MISAKGFFLPLEIYQGNTLDFDFEFILDGLHQSTDQWLFLGAVSNESGIEVEKLIVTQHDNILLHVATESDYVTLKAGTYTYEIKAVHKANKRVSTLLRGSFMVYQSSLVNV